MVPDDELLQSAARNGAFEKSRWPEVLERLLPRLDHIVYNEFEMPVVPRSGLAHHPNMNGPESGRFGNITSEEMLQEHESKLSIGSTTSQSPVTSGSLLPSSTVIPDSQPSDKLLPPQLEILYTNIKANLKDSFQFAPPFTVQRLAELILKPSHHYRTLPSYLRALDRIVCVSSTADVFPLPSLASADNEGNGNTLLASSASRGIVEDFNGAALTRIPWLRDTASMMMSSDRPLTSDLRTESTSLIDGPNGAGSVETVTVSVNGLPRTAKADGQHRHEASANMSSAIEGGTVEREASPQQAGHEDDLDEERVHARGPNEIGSADIGPQTDRVGHVFDVEAAVGRPGEAETVTPSSTAANAEGDGDAPQLSADEVELAGANSPTTRTQHGSASTEDPVK